MRFFKPRGAEHTINKRIRKEAFSSPLYIYTCTYAYLRTFSFKVPFLGHLRAIRLRVLSRVLTRTCVLSPINKYKYKFFLYIYISIYEKTRKYAYLYKKRRVSIYTANPLFLGICGRKDAKTRKNTYIYKRGTFLLFDL